MQAWHDAVRRNGGYFDGLAHPRDVLGCIRKHEIPRLKVTGPSGQPCVRSRHHLFIGVERYGNPKVMDVAIVHVIERRLLIQCAPDSGLS